MKKARMRRAFLEGTVPTIPSLFYVLD